MAQCIRSTAETPSSSTLCTPPVLAFVSSRAHFAARAHAASSSPSSQGCFASATLVTGRDGKQHEHGVAREFQDVAVVPCYDAYCSCINLVDMPFQSIDP